MGKMDGIPCEGWAPRPRGPTWASGPHTAAAAEAGSRPVGPSRRTPSVCEGNSARRTRTMRALGRSWFCIEKRLPVRLHPPHLALWTKVCIVRGRGQDGQAVLPSVLSTFRDPASRAFPALSGPSHLPSPKETFHEGWCARVALPSWEMGSSWGSGQDVSTVIGNPQAGTDNR